MRAFVFTDRSLARYAGRFVWLEIDTEKAKNAALRKRLGIVALPTFFVLAPDSERVALRWVGGATLPQLVRLLDDASTALVASAAPATGDADAMLARAERLYGEADYAAAAGAYEQTLALAPAGWPGYGRAVEALLFALSLTDGTERGARLAREAFPRLSHTASAANVAASGLDFALELPAEHAERRALVSALEADAREVTGDPALPIAADDRSAVFGSLVDARKDAGDSTGARRTAEQWASFLEGEAARAANPGQRTVFDSHRLAVYLELGEPERAIPMLSASERDFPDDYNPPARLALAYKAMRRWDDALACSDRAMRIVYGPRKLLVMQARAEIFTGRGDAAGARRTLQEALAFAEALPAGQRSENTIATLKKKLGALPQ